MNSVKKFVLVCFYALSFLAHANTYIPGIKAYYPSSIPQYTITSASASSTVTEVSCSPNIPPPIVTTQTSQVIIPQPVISSGNAGQATISASPAPALQPIQTPIPNYPTAATPAFSPNALLSDLHAIPTATYNFVRSHPYITATISVAALSYGYLLYRCWHIKKYLAQHNSWSAWKIQIPLHILKESLQEEVGDALMADIKKQYQISAGGYDLMRALLVFNDELERELKKLNTYKALVEYLDADYIRSILPDLNSLKIGLNDRIARILYLKDILYTWMHTNNRSLIGLSVIS